MRHDRPVDPGDPGEQGTISTWVALTTVAMMLFVGLAVDFGGQVIALQNVRSVAAEAARTGGQQVDLAQAMRGEDVTVDASAARSAAYAYLNDPDGDGSSADAVDGEVTFEDGTRLVVIVNDVYETKVLTIIGIPDLPVTGVSEANLVPVLGGEEL